MEDFSLAQDLSFFKVIFTSKNLDVPRALIARMRGSLLPDLILADKYNNTWRLGVSRNKDTWCLKEGWRQFYEENFVEPGDIIVFEHNHDNIFHFKMLGPDACAKKGVGQFQPRAEPEEIEYNNDDYGIECIKNNDNSDEDDDGGDSDNDEDYSIESIHDNDDSDDSDYTVEDKIEEYKQGAKSQGIRSSRNQNSSRQSTRHHCRKSMSNVGGGRDADRGCTKQRIRKISDWCGEEIFKLGLVSRPRNPYFVARPRVGRYKNRLSIPQELIAQNHINLPEQVLLVDEKGRPWTAKIRRWKDGRLWCSHGWKSFCNVNGIQYDDICICELVQNGSGDMRVFVRVVYPRRKMNSNEFQNV